MRNRIVLLKIIALVSFGAICFGCRGVNYQYVDENSRLRPVLKVPAGSSIATLEFGVDAFDGFAIVQDDYPIIIASYASDAKEADKLQKLEVKLFVDGKEIAADETLFEASHFHTTIHLTETECCANLGQKLKIGEYKPADGYRFGVRVSKKYQSLDRLPPQLTVVISATTDKGTVEMTKTLNLKEYEDSSFIRFH